MNEKLMCYSLEKLGLIQDSKKKHLFYFIIKQSLIPNYVFFWYNSELERFFLSSEPNIEEDIRLEDIMEISEFILKLKEKYK